MGEPRWEYIQDGARIVRRDKTTPRRLVVETLRPSDAVDLINALEAESRVLRAALVNPHGCCWDCGEFVGYDRVQEVQGTAEHEEYCSIAAALASPQP